jgi:hypothetical protein
MVGAFLPKAIINVGGTVSTGPTGFTCASVRVVTVLALSMPTVFVRAIVNVDLASFAVPACIASAREGRVSILAITMPGTILRVALVDGGDGDGGGSGFGSEFRCEGSGGCRRTCTIARLAVNGTCALLAEFVGSSDHLVVSVVLRFAC